MKKVDIVICAQSQMYLYLFSESKKFLPVSGDVINLSVWYSMFHRSVWFKASSNYLQLFLFLQICSLPELHQLLDRQTDRPEEGGKDKCGLHDEHYKEVRKRIIIKTS